MSVTYDMSGAGRGGEGRQTVVVEERDGDKDDCLSHETPIIVVDYKYIKKAGGERVVNGELCLMDCIRTPLTCNSEVWSYLCKFRSLML